MSGSILVAVSGGPSDAQVFETALAAAQPVAAHLDFLHIIPTLDEATLNTPHADYAMGRGIVATLDSVNAQITHRSRTAERHVREFCAQHSLAVTEGSQARGQISASWQQITGDPLDCLTFQARHHDLVVMGRRRGTDGLPGDLLELVLVQSGCPLLVAPASGHPLAGAAVVAWKECAESRHALVAAMPLLRACKRTVLVTVEEGAASGDVAKAGLRAAARHLAWHGIAADTEFVPADRYETAADALASVASEQRAALLVMGAYGHSRMREIIFGGCTERFLRDAACAVLFVT